MGTIEVFRLFGSIFVDNDEANKSISKTGKEADGLGKKFLNGIKTAGKWAIGVGAAAAGIGTAAFAMTKKVTGAFDDIAKNARKMGVSTDYYQEMEYWASQNGLSHENMEKSMKRLNQRLGQAVNGNKKYSDTLTKLGVDLKEVEKGNVSTEQAMTQSIQALSEMENSQQKAALAADLFGVKLAQELMPTLDKGALSIEEAQKKAEELGIVIAEDTLNAAEEFNDTWDDLTRSFSAFGQKLIAGMMPFFQMLMNWAMDHMPTIQKVFSTTFDVIGFVLQKVGKGIRFVIDWFKRFKSNTSDTFESVKSFFKLFAEVVIEDFVVVFEKIQEVVQKVFDFIVPIIQDGLALLKNLWDDHGSGVFETVTNALFAVEEFIVYEIIRPLIDFISNALDQIILFWENNGEQILETVMKYLTSAKEYYETVFNAIWTVIKTIFDLVVPFIQEQLAKIKAFWDENGEQIMEAAKNVFTFIMTIATVAFNTIKGIVEFVMPIIVSVIKGAWDIVSSIFKTTIDVILGIIKFFISLFTGDIEGMKDSIIGIFKSLLNGIKGVLGGAWNLIKGTVTSLIKSIANVFGDLPKMALEWGKNMIKGFVDGIKNMGKAVADAASGVVKKAAGFLKFWSPAKEGEGRFITDWGENMVDGFLDGVRNETSEAGKVMNDLIESMNPNKSSFVNSTIDTNGRTNTSSKKSPETVFNNYLPEIISLLMDLIQAVREGKEISISGRKLNEEMDNEQGKRINMNERRVAY